MKIKNNALIISQKSDFIKKYLSLLQKNNFYVSKVKSIHNWREREDAYFDLCLIDNREGNFDYEEFFKKRGDTNSKSLIINVGMKQEKFESNHALLYHLDPELQSIELEIFIKNTNRILGREKIRTELAETLLHDIRSPLNSLITYLELLLNETFGEMNEGQKNFLEKAMLLGDQVIDMMEEINEIYQNEHYTFHLEKEVFPLSELLDEVLLKIWIQADSKNMKIKKELPQKLPVIFGDPFQIQRVFINLIGNSIKYCPQNSKIVILAKPGRDDFVEVEIRDNGGGVAKAQLKKIFHKFVRAEQHIGLKQSKGLGLYISKLIVKAHKGKIWAENNQSGGLSFFFTLPTKK